MTITEIAKKAGVSSMTVSNVINGHTKRVSQKTSDKVQRIMEENNYVPNLSARSLRASSNIIAVFVPLVKSQTHNNIFLDPYLSQMIGIFEENLRQKGFFAMIRSVENINDINLMIQNWNVDGAILVYPYFENQIDILLKNNKIPLVFLDSFKNNPRALTVNINDAKGTYLATKRLIELGHTKIAFVGNYEGNTLVTSRFNGYHQAMEEAHLTVEKDFIYTVDSIFSEGAKVGKDIVMNKDFTAAVTTADISAAGIIEGVRSAGYSVPEDLSVTGYDDTFISTLVYPQLTTVNQHIKEKATSAVTLLLDKIKGKTGGTNHILLDVELIERNSTAKP